MSYSFVLLPGDGSNSTFAFSFPFLDRAHVAVKVNGTITAFTWLTDSTIQILPAPTGVVEIRRNTPLTSAPVDFTDGSVLSEGELDLLATFNLYCTQEARDVADTALGLGGTVEWDGRGFSTTNFADAVDPTGLITKQQLEGTYKPAIDASVASAAASAAVASASASSAQGYALSADNSADQAAALLAIFKGQYLGPLASNPSVDGNGQPVTAGDIYFDTTNSVMKVFTGSMWVAAGSTVAGTINTPTSPVIATTGQTTVIVPGGYDAGFITVFVDGTKWDPPEITVTSGVNIVFTTPLSGGEEISWVAYGAFNVADGIPAALHSIDGLRGALKTSPMKFASVTGYYAQNDGGGGMYYLDIADSTSADDGGTVIVATDGGRWKLLHNGTVTARQFGARGAPYDDYVPLQNALNACALQRIGRLELTSGSVYQTSAQLLIRQGAQTTSSAAGSDIHFMPDQNKLVVSSDSHATLKATAAMSSVLKVSPTTVGGLGSYANFYSEIHGLRIDGNGLAGIGISIDSAMHVKVWANAIFGVTTGIFTTGYGVHDVKYNVIRATLCISYLGGGDSMFEHNDLFIATGGSGFLMKPFGGSTLLHRNTYTPLDTTVADNGTKGVELRADSPGDDTKVLGAIRIAHEAFDGIRYGVYGRGYSASAINLRAIDIHDCYIGGAGSATGQLFDFAFATALNIHDNDVTPGAGEPPMRSLGTLYTVTSSKVHDNSINSCTGDGLVLDGACSNVVVENNKLDSVGLGNTTQAHVRVKGTSDSNYIRRNLFNQPFSTGALNGVVEEGSANRTFADYNEMSGGQITAEYAKVGANSVMKSRLQRSAAPASGAWLVGSLVEYTAPTAGGKIGAVCTAAGTPGTWKAYGAIDP